MICLVLFFSGVGLCSERPIQVREEIWPDIDKGKEKPVSLSNQRLVGQLHLNKSPVDFVLSDLASEDGLHTILDKSVKFKRLSGTFENCTRNEVFQLLLRQTGLQARFLTDHVILIEDSSTQRNLYEESYEPEIPDTKRSSSKQQVGSVN